MKTLRASKAGFPCNRYLYYSVNNYESTISTRTKRIFGVGKALEPEIVKWLRDDGWEVDYNPGSQEAALELFYPLDNGRLAGHPDCFISKGEMQHVLADIKTMKERAFKLWRQEGSIKHSPQYVDQLHIYAGAAIKAGYTVEHLAIVGVNKNDSDMHIDIFDYSPERFKAICERSQAIMNLENAPEEDSPREGWCCGYCEFSDLCELSPNYTRKAEIANSDTVVTQDEEIIRAMEQLQEARIMSHTVADMESEAKAVLDERVRKQGITSIRGGDFLLSIKERTSSRFDTAAFKKERPELVSQFMKESKSTFFNVESLEPKHDD